MPASRVCLCRRYVSDMLAWVHQAIAQEKDLFEQVFGSGPVDEAAAAAPSSPTGAEAEQSVDIGQLLDKVRAVSWVLVH